MKIKSIALNFTNEGVDGNIVYTDQEREDSLSFSYDPGYGWQQWGAELDILKKTTRIMRMVFEDNAEFIDDLAGFIDVTR